MGEDYSAAAIDQPPLMYFIVQSFRFCIFLMTHPLFPLSTLGGLLLKHTSEQLESCTCQTSLRFMFVDGTALVEQDAD